MGGKDERVELVLGQTECKAEEKDCRSSQRNDVNVVKVRGESTCGPGRPTRPTDPGGPFNDNWKKKTTVLIYVQRTKCPFTFNTQ